jgi:hypothetical protein
VRHHASRHRHAPDRDVEDPHSGDGKPASRPAGPDARAGGGVGPPQGERRDRAQEVQGTNGCRFVPEFGRDHSPHRRPGPRPESGGGDGAEDATLQRATSGRGRSSPLGASGPGAEPALPASYQGRADALGAAERTGAGGDRLAAGLRYPWIFPGRDPARPIDNLKPYGLGFLLCGSTIRGSGLFPVLPVRAPAVGVASRAVPRRSISQHDEPSWPDVPGPSACLFPVGGGCTSP